MSNGSEIPFSCRCGSLTGTLQNVRPTEGTHLICHCDSCCRGMQIHAIDANRRDGVALFQTTPDRIQIATGIDQLAVKQMTPKGPLRWYASCCSTPMFNTTGSRGFAFTGVLVHCLADTAPLGPVVGECYFERTENTPRHRHFPRLVWRVIRRAAIARLTGKWRENPFFGNDNRPIARPDQPLP